MFIRIEKLLHIYLKYFGTCLDTAWPELSGIKKHLDFSSCLNVGKLAKVHPQPFESYYLIALWPILVYL